MEKRPASGPKTGFSINLPSKRKPWDIAYGSHNMRFNVSIAECPIALPVAVDPVKLILRTKGWNVRYSVHKDGRRFFEEADGGQLDQRVRPILP